MMTALGSQPPEKGTSVTRYDPWAQ